MMVMPKPLSEAAFTEQVLQLMALCDWRTAHFRPAMRSDGSWRTPVAGDGKGWPDIVALRGVRIVVAELKTATGRTTPEQDAWLDAWRSIPGAEVHVWRPVDLDNIGKVMR